MRAGAVGLNSGLDYQPTSHSDTRELIALARVAAEHGGVYAAHGRNQTAGPRRPVPRDGRGGPKAGLPVSVSHERVDEEMAALLDEAAADPSVDLATDSHLYEAGSTHLLNYVPFDEHDGGPMAVLERLGIGGLPRGAAPASRGVDRGRAGRPQGVLLGHADRPPPRPHRRRDRRGARPEPRPRRSSTCCARNSRTR